MAEYEGFEYVNLADIEPDSKTVPADVYALKVVKMVKEDYTPKTGPNANVLCQRISAQFAIIDNEQYAGRRLFHRFGLNKFNLQQLRKLADVTGVNVNQPVDQVAAEFANLQPEFKIKVDLNPQRSFTEIDPATGKKAIILDPVTGEPVMQNELNFREIFVY